MSDVTALLAEAAWLTRLARGLVGNDDADDIVQETYAAALRTPPDPDRPARPWLRRVMVNVVRMRHRGRVRRDTREQAFGSEPTRTPEQLLERARVERTLADLVIALGEPLCSTVLLRYREGHSAEAIAKQQEVSVATVRRRLSEAVEHLRAGMDEHETSKPWRAAFAPFLVARPTSPPLWSLIMAKAATKLAILAIAALLLLLGGGVVWHHSREVSRSSTPTERHVMQGATAGPTTRVRVFEQPGVKAQQLVGRVTLANQPFAGAQVRVTHATTRELVAEATSGADGRFTIPNLPAAALIVSATSEDKMAMPVAVDLRSPAARTHAVELRLAGCAQLHGIVSDGSGAPISHARIAPEASPAPFADTDELGRFAVCAHPGLQRIRFAASGYHSVVVAVQLWGDAIQDVTLLPEAIVAGTVVDTANRLVADAVITIDPRGKNSMSDASVIARSGADGTFRIGGVAPGRSELFAEAPGLTSRRIGLVLGAGETREAIVLRLEHAPQLAGKVIDSHGAPASGASVGLRVGSVLRDNLAVTQADGSFVIDRAPKRSIRRVRSAARSPMRRAPSCGASGFVPRIQRSKTSARARPTTPARTASASCATTAPSRSRPGPAARRFRRSLRCP
jgi:RNA polymerase sigma factor (sigma-70 family)